MLKFCNIFLLVIALYSADSARAASSLFELPKEVIQFFQARKHFVVEFTEFRELKQLDGILIIQRPFYMRCNYQQDFPLLILANQKYVSIYDFELDSLTRVSAEENIFNFLLQEPENWQKHLNIINIKRSPTSLDITLRTKQSEQEIILSFQQDPLWLRQITLLTQEEMSSWQIKDIYRIKPMPLKFFQIKDPDIFGPSKPVTLNELRASFEKKD